MAYRKKEDMIISFDIKDLKNTVLNNNFGGNILILSSLYNFSKYKEFLPQGDNIKIATFNDDFYYGDTIGLVLILGNDNEINTAIDKIKNFDISVIAVVTEFVNTTYVGFNFFKLYIVPEIIKEDIIKANILKCLYMITINKIHLSIKGKENIEYIPLDNIEFFTFKQQVMYFVRTYRKHTLSKTESEFFEIFKNQNMNIPEMVTILKIYFEFLVNFAVNVNLNPQNILENTNKCFNDEFCTILNFYKLCLDRYYVDILSRYNYSDDFKSRFNKPYILSKLNDFYQKEIND